VPSLFLDYFTVSEHILCLGEPNRTRALFSVGDWALLRKQPLSRQPRSRQPSNAAIETVFCRYAFNSQIHKFLAKTS